MAIIGESGCGKTVLQHAISRQAEADIVIASTASPLPVLGKGVVERALKKRRHRPMFLVDIAVPRDIEAQVGEYVEFVATTADVTYGLGVFRPDNTLVFQMQVPPGRESRIIWKLDTSDSYNVRSTEYSGPRHSEMYYADAIRVTQ